MPTSFVLASLTARLLPGAGPTTPLTRGLYSPPPSLLVQARQPRCLCFLSAVGRPARARSLTSRGLRQWCPAQTQGRRNQSRGPWRVSRDSARSHRNLSRRYWLNNTSILLPETWQLESERSCCHSKRPRRSAVTDISLWTECYATMAAILLAAFPEKAPHFFAYLRTISKASRNFEGSARHMTWRSDVRPHWIGGVSTPPSTTRHLLGGPSSSHGVAIAWQTRIRHMNARIPRRKPQAAPPRRKAARPGPCRDRRDPRAALRPLSTYYAGCIYNSPGRSRCRFPLCRYAHLCSRCRRPHSLAKCSERARQQQAATSASGQSAPQTVTGGSTQPTT